jgi:hypothetical protein
MKNDWKPYKGEYNKRWYEAMDKDGNIYLCWPNAGLLVPVIPSGHNPFDIGDCEYRETDRHPLDCLS